MIEYPKIENLYIRDELTHKVQPGNWRLPEFEYLATNQWLFTEKVDGTNVRVMWDGTRVTFGGRTDAAQMPTFLLSRLQDLFPPEKLGIHTGPVCLYGEGYGAKIQKGGGNYKADGVDFVLFDVRVGEWWLRWEDTVEVGVELGVDVVPRLGVGTLHEATAIVQGGLESHWGKFPAEGLVVRPLVDLKTRAGHRIIGKLKTADF